MSRLKLIVFVLGLLAASECFASEGVPGWVKALSDSADPVALAGDAVLVRDETSLQVATPGDFVTTRRTALRVRNVRGVQWARSIAPYVTGESRVREMRGWIVSPGEVPRELGGRFVLDIALSGGDFFNESRAQVLDAAQAISPGQIFACEWITEDRPPFLQVDLSMTGGMPVRHAESLVELPPRWRLESHIFGPDSCSELIEGNRWRWQCFDRPGVIEEESSPAASASATRIALRLIPPEPIRPPDFADWNDVGNWLRQLAAPASVAGRDLKAHANELLGSSRTEMARLRAAADIAQQVRYVSIQLGIGRGGGYRPRPARQVLNTGYGDCKDKANLLVSLVRTMGGRAWLVPTYVGDKTFVRAEWATPQQFNHCIAAIAVSDSVHADAVLRHPVLGPILLVDPTDPLTPLGQLPDVEQGSRALVVADSGGFLISLPVAPLEHAGIEYEMDAVLTDAGSISATHQLKLRGASAAELRARQARFGIGAIEMWIVEAVQRGAPGCSVSAPQWDEEVDGTLRIRYETTMKDLLRPLGDSTSAWCALGCPIEHPTPVRAAGRRTSLATKRTWHRERISLQLSPTWTLATAPPEVLIERDFGRMYSRTISDSGVVRIERGWSTTGSVVPANRAAEVRELYGAVMTNLRALHLLKHRR